MACRGYIAKVEPDGSGRYVYLGNQSYPSHAGETLLRHYQEPEKVEALLNLGSICKLRPETKDVETYHDHWNDSWDNCAPTPFHGGTDTFFLNVYQPGPEWLYCWTPDGWLASAVKCHDIPPSFVSHATARMTPEAFEHWFDHNQDPEWVQWRAACRERQQPRPLLEVIQNYATELAQRQAENSNS